MKSADTKSSWYADPPTAQQASRIVAWISIASGSVLGLIVLGSLCTGTGSSFWGSVFAAGAIQLFVQAAASGLSWKAGARCAKLSLGLLCVVACSCIAFQHDVKILSVFTVPAIASLTAVKIEREHTKLHGDTRTA